ncbi:hypothetical protein NEFER03_2271, partial [Nematocida sp. LUAm3]
TGRVEAGEAQSHRHSAAHRHRRMRVFPREACAQAGKSAGKSPPKEKKSAGVRRSARSAGKRRARRSACVHERRRRTKQREEAPQAVPRRARAQSGRTERSMRAGRRSEKARRKNKENRTKRRVEYSVFSRARESGGGQAGQLRRPAVCPGAAACERVPPAAESNPAPAKVRRRVRGTWREGARAVPTRHPAQCAIAVVCVLLRAPSGKECTGEQSKSAGERTHAPRREHRSPHRAEKSAAARTGRSAC